MSGELISISAIERQAQRDAIDALNGHAVHNPYASAHDAHNVWQHCFESRCAELAQEETT